MRTLGALERLEQVPISASPSAAGASFTHRRSAAARTSSSMRPRRRPNSTAAPSIANAASAASQRPAIETRLSVGADSALATVVASSRAAPGGGWPLGLGTPNWNAPSTVWPSSPYATQLTV
jgi:hypothetical protein